MHSPASGSLERGTDCCHEDLCHLSAGHTGFRADLSGYGHYLRSSIPLSLHLRLARTKHSTKKYSLSHLFRGTRTFFQRVTSVSSIAPRGHATRGQSTRGQATPERNPKSSLARCQPPGLRGRLSGLLMVSETLAVIQVLWELNSHFLCPCQFN